MDTGIYRALLPRRSVQSSGCYHILNSLRFPGLQLPSEKAAGIWIWFDEDTDCKRSDTYIASAFYRCEFTCLDKIVVAASGAKWPECHVLIPPKIGSCMIGSPSPFSWGARYVGATIRNTNMVAPAIPSYCMLRTALFTSPSCRSVWNLVVFTKIAEWARLIILYFLALRAPTATLTLRSISNMAHSKKSTGPPAIPPVSTLPSFSNRLFPCLTRSPVQSPCFLCPLTEEERADNFFCFHSANTTDTSYFWNGRPTQNLGLGDIFFMAMYNSSESGPPLFRSQYINVTMSASSSSVTTSSLSSTASSSSSHPTVQPNTTPVSTTATTIPTASSTPKPTANHVALGAGLGVGLGGAALLLAGGLSFFLSRKRHSKSRKRTPEVYQLAENDRFSQWDVDVHRAGEGKVHFDGGFPAFLWWRFLLGVRVDGHRNRKMADDGDWRVYPASG